MKIQHRYETSEITKTIVEKRNEKVFELTLYTREALALMLILRGIGGDTETTARKYTDKLECYLSRELTTNYCVSELKTGEIYFKPESLKWVDKNAEALSTKLQ